MPIIIKADDNNIYVLKTRFDGILADKKDYGIFIETLTYKLLQSFNFKNIPEIVYLIIDDIFLEDAESKFINSKNERELEALSNIKNSKGLNLGIKWIHNSEKYNKKLLKDLLQKSINYDGYIMNSDRNVSNPNMLFSQSEKKIYLIDFAGAFEMLMAFDDIKNESFDISKFFDKFTFDNDYLFFQETKSILSLKNRVSKEDILKLIDELPKDWQPHQFKDRIAEIISERVGNKRIFRQ
jgi:hypothetical protein